MLTWIGGGANSWYHVRGREASLFDVLEVVARIFVQGEASNAAQWVSLVRPSESVVKDVDGCIFDFLRLDHLDINSPGREITILDGVEQVLDMVVGLCASQIQSSIGIHGLDALVGLEVPFDIDVASILLLRLVFISFELHWIHTALFRV